MFHFNMLYLTNDDIFGLGTLHFNEMLYLKMMTCLKAQLSMRQKTCETIFITQN
jgi:hypothetical protein